MDSYTKITNFNETIAGQECWTLPEAFEELVECEGSSLVGELLQVFQQDTERRMREARSAIANGDAVKLKAEVHSIKGSARQMGANVMGAVCQDIEFSIGQAPLARLADRMDELEAHFAAVCQAMRNYSGG